jgi:flagellar biosynthesis chaperone FliJ
MQIQQVVDIIATINGKDETFQNLPINVEIAQKGNDTFSGSREAMLQAVDAMLQTSKKAIEQVPYHKSVISESEKMLEVLNPQYAENKQNARVIQTLKEKQAVQEQQLAELKAQNSEMLSILRQLNGSPSVSPVNP